MQPARVGIIGCGAISSAYFKNSAPFEILDIVACADLLPEKAAAQAAEFGVPRACSVEELLQADDLDIVVNLTIPQAHAEINLAALEAGKHAYCEKPYAVTVDEGRAVVAAAEKLGLRSGCAPDTFLGGGQQTARKVLDDGWIGAPVAGVAFMICHGHESWHPSPAFYYQRGGGPMFDMGPYYLTALVNLLGPVKRVAACTAITFPERTITSEPLRGTRVAVEVATHVAGTLEFVNGTIVTMITSFDVWAGNLPRIEIYGTEGSMTVPDPNGFGGEVKVLRPGDDWHTVPHSHRCELGRGTGVADLATAVAHGRPHRASAALAFHVLEVMSAFERSSDRGEHVQIASTCARPAPLPLGLPAGQLDP